MTATIYALCDSRVADRTLRVRYIGQTIRTLARRLAIHWQTVDAGQRIHRAEWMRSVRLGGGSVEIEALAVVPRDDADTAEVDAIARYRSLGCDLTNGTIGGQGVRGYVCTPETRAKMRAAAVARPPVSPEAIAKRSRSLRATYARPEIREKARRINIGRVRSAETRAKMSKALLGEGNGQAKLSDESAAAIRAAYASGGVSLAAVGKSFSVSAPTVHRVVHGRGWASR